MLDYLRSGLRGEWQANAEARAAERRVVDVHRATVKRGLLRHEREAEPRAGSYRTGSALKALEYVVSLDAGHSRPVVLD
jgi:hypothetical protein